MTQSSAVLPRRGFGFALSAVAAIAMLAGASAPSPFYPALQERLALPPVGITIAFAVYALGLLAALLTAGSLSDHVGRRPVISVGFVLLAAAVLVLWSAQSGIALDIARALQGIASGPARLDALRDGRRFRPSRTSRGRGGAQLRRTHDRLASGAIVAASCSM